MVFIVVDLDFYIWNDEEWMEKCCDIDLFIKFIFVYECYLGFWIYVFVDELVKLFNGKIEFVV